jgi:hypothetical protein
VSTGIEHTCCCSWLRRVGPDPPDPDAARRLDVPTAFPDRRTPSARSRTLTRGLLGRRTVHSSQRRPKESVRTSAGSATGIMVRVFPAYAEETPAEAAIWRRCRGMLRSSWNYDHNGGRASDAAIR